MLTQFYPQTKHGYMYELNKDFTFAAAHFIPAEGAGKCQNVHGHNYTVNLTIAGDELDEMGFLVNFSAVKKLVSDRYDHTLLNNHSEFEGEESYQFPTTEVVARQIWEMVSSFLNTEQPNKPECVQVVVRETPTSYVVFRPR